MKKRAYERILTFVTAQSNTPIVMWFEHRHANALLKCFKHSAHPCTINYLPVDQHLYVDAMVGDQWACRGIDGSGHWGLADSLAVTSCQLATTICQKKSEHSKPMDKMNDDIDGFVHEKHNSNLTEETKTLDNSSLLFIRNGHMRNSDIQLLC